MKIKNIVFDMGNVLFPLDCAHFIRAFGPKEEDVFFLESSIFKSVAWVSYDRGTMIESEALAEILTNVPVRLKNMASNIFKYWHQHIIPNEQMFAFAKKLQQSGYRIYLLSNAAQNFYTFKEKLPGLAVFDGIFISSDWKLLKPETQIYEQFCDHFSLKPSSCLFVDDSPVNIESAKRFGMQGIVFHGDVKQLKDEIGKISKEIAICLDN